MIFFPSYVFSLIYPFNHERCICKSNSSRTSSKSSMILGMRKKRILRECSRRSGRRWSSQVLLVLQMLRNIDSSIFFHFLWQYFQFHWTNIFTSEANLFPINFVKVLGRWFEIESLKDKFFFFFPHIKTNFTWLKKASYMFWRERVMYMCRKFVV